eukprot:m.181140 g.181140  ORF g.181140 m.181140 type:complete len:290 (+) comp39266_c0_seq9:73-942(+)
MSIDLSQIGSSSRERFRKIFTYRNVLETRGNPHILYPQLCNDPDESIRLQLHMSGISECLLPIVSGKDSWTKWHEEKYKGNVTIGNAQRVKGISGWWPGGRDKQDMWDVVYNQSQLKTSSRFRQFLYSYPRALARLQLVTEEVPGLYVFQHKDVSSFRYVGMTAESLSKRIYTHLTTAFSKGTAVKSELLSVPLCLTHASQWLVELYPVALLKAMGFKIRDKHEDLQEDLKALEILLIAARSSAWPNGCNLKIELSASQKAMELFEQKSAGSLPNSSLIFENQQCSLSF